jgi:two-component system, NarL family, sensor kinase
VSPRVRARLAWSLLGVVACFSGAGAVFNALVPDTADVGWGTFAAVVLGLIVPFGAVGAVIASRGVGGPIGWICLGISLVMASSAAGTGYGTWGILGDHESLPGRELVLYADSWTWVVFIGLIGVFLVLYFPDGRLPSRRWRWLPLFAAAGMTIAIAAIALFPGTGVAEGGAVEVENPIGISSLEGLLEGLALAGIGMLFISIVSAMVAAVVRFRRAEREQRLQLKWFATAAVVAVGVFFSSWPASFVSAELEHVLQDASLYAWALLPIAAGVAVLKYRLYDIDVVINRSLVYTALTVFVVGAYAGLVAFADSVSSRGGAASSLFAAVVVAVAFAPVKERVQRTVDRLLYGERRDPYRALSQLGSRLEAALSPEDVLPAVVGTVAQALRVPYAAVELRDEDGSHVVASVGSAKGGEERVALHYRGELVGELAIGLRPGESDLSPADRKLLDDLARQVGVAAHAVTLTLALQRSRERIVTAREEERRRLRRDLHDGLGPALAGVALQLDTAANLIGQDAGAADDLLARIREQTQGVIADIRRLVYDLRPPALDELGLAGAIREQAARLDGGVRITVDAPSRLPELPAAVEVAAYRIGLEALTNVVRHANASSCAIRLSVNGVLELEIADDGDGLAPERRTGIGLGSMRERAAELGGTCTIEPRRQGGTRVYARFPLRTT